MARQYAAFIHKESKGEYGVSFPDFPGCISAGSTPEEAYAMAEEALQLHVDGMLEDGEPVPEPVSLTTAFDDMPEVGASAVILVSVKMPARAKRINITIEENLLADIDAAAESRRVSRSYFLAEGAQYLLALIKSTPA